MDRQIGDPGRKQRQNRERVMHHFKGVKKGGVGGRLDARADVRRHLARELKRAEIHAELGERGSAARKTVGEQHLKMRI